MTTSPDPMPDPIPFKAPGAADGPTRGADCNWVGWRMADARANSLERENRRLTNEVRDLDTKYAGLEERVGSLQDRQRLVKICSTILLALAGIFGGRSVMEALSGAPERGNLAIILGVLALILLVAGAVIEWIPIGRRGRLPRRQPDGGEGPGLDRRTPG